MSIFTRGASLLYSLVPPGADSTFSFGPPVCSYYEAASSRRLIVIGQE